MSHYLKQCWLISLTHICGTRVDELNESLLAYCLLAHGHTLEPISSFNKMLSTVSLQNEYSCQHSLKSICGSSQGSSRLSLIFSAEDLLPFQKFYKFNRTGQCASLNMLIAFQELQEPKDCQTVLQVAGKVKPVVMQNISFGFPEAFKKIGGPNLVPMLMILNEALLRFWSAANREAAIFNSQDHHHNTKWIHIQYRKSIVVQYKMLWSRCLWYVYGVFVFLIK